MAEIVTQPSIDPDYRYESRARTNSSGTAPSTPSSSSDYVTGVADDSSESKATVPFTLKSVDALLSISKAASPDDLQEMVEKCKRMVLESAECSEERKWLVRRLIELRLRAQELRETSGDNLMETQVMLGHHLVPQKYYIATSGPTYCDHCSGAIWTMLQSWYMCRDCSFCSHWKCINDIRRVCAHVVASETGGYTYTKDICPEKGLSAQGYRCAECHTKITFKSAWVEPRLCDYSGLFYCQRCHWNSMAVIPARVVRNWDMEPRKVCRSASQLLTLLEDRPVLSLEHLNPKLFTLIPDLSLIKMLKLLNRIRVDWQVWAQDRDVNVLHKYAEQGRKMTIMYTVTIYSTGSLFMIQPIIPAIIDVFVKNGSRHREFPLPVDYYHLDAQKHYFYIMMYSYPCVSLGLLVTMAHDALFIVYVQHCCGTFTALGQKLERIANNEKSAQIGKTSHVLKKKDMIFERLVSCVERHNDAIEFAELIEATYSWCLFFIVGIHVVEFSILGLQIVKRSHDHQGLIRHIAWLLAGVMNLYLYNYMSQVLTDHTISIRCCIYNGKWYRLSPKVLQFLHFMMMRCNASCNLTAGKISTMSVKTFGVMLKMLDRIRADWQAGAQDRDFNSLHKYAEQGRKMTIMCAVTIYAVGILFITQPIIPAIIDVFLQNGSRPREFPFPVDYYHLDAQKYYFYIILCSYPCMSLGLLVTIAYDTMFIVYVQHCCGTFTVLGHKLERIVENEKSAAIGEMRCVLEQKDMMFERLVSCVKRHNDAIEFAELIEATYSWCLFFAVGVQVVGFSIIGLQIVKKSNNLQDLVRFIAWLLGGVVHLYIYSYMAQVLMDRSISIRYYIYNGKWYRLSPKFLQILHFMMMRCNLSCNLTAGKVSIMSVQTFGVRLREELQMMKRYLVFCPDADFQGLPWRTGLRTHLIENSSNYSMKDLVDLQSGVLMEEIRSAYDAMRNHITDVCELCRARGHLCELCGNDEVIYPWDTSAISCQQCAAVHHRVCWAKRNNCCPRCTRIQQRLALKSQETIDDVEDTLTNDRH